MSSDRYVVMGLARSRAGWFTDMGRWATTAAIPVEFVRCLSTEELRARLEAGRQVSAVLLDTTVVGVDRDLLDLINTAGAVVVAVATAPPTNWPAGIDAACLHPEFDRQQLLDVLAQHAQAIHRADEAIQSPAPLVRNPWSGTLIAVTGHGGAGTSTVTMGLAQSLGSDPRNLGLVLLADLAMDADQAMLHDARRLVPGLQEAVEAHRGAGLRTDDVRNLVHAIEGRSYDLLLGLRNHHDWTALRPRAVAALLDSLLHTYRTVVADVDADLEGLDRTGSVDVEDRNQLARLTMERASVVVVVATPGLAGVHKLCRTIARLADQGVDPARILPVINQMRGSIKARAEVAAAIGALLRSDLRPASPTFVTARKRLDTGLLDGRGLPNNLCKAVASAASSVAERTRESTIEAAAAKEPIAVAPGSLGSFFPDEETA